MNAVRCGRCGISYDPETRYDLLWVVAAPFVDRRLDVAKTSSEYVLQQQWWAKSNSDSIQSLFESQRRFDSNVARFDSSTMRFDTDSIQILTIRFKRHAIWTENSNMVEIEYSFSLLTYSVRSYLQTFGFTHHWCMPAIIRSQGRLWTARSMHVKALLRKWKFQWLPLAGTNKIEMFAKVFLLFRDLRFDLRFGVWGFKILVWNSIQDLRFGLKIWISSEEDLRF